MPSMKLKLFISATIQSIVTGYCSAPRSSGSSSGSVRWSIVAPALTGMAAAAELAGELDDRVDLEAVVEQADRRAHAGAEQDRVRAAAQRRLQQQHRHRDRDEHRDAAAERDRAASAGAGPSCGGRRGRRARRPAPRAASARARARRPGRTRRARRGGPASRARLDRSRAARPLPPGPKARTRTTSVPRRGVFRTSRDALRRRARVRALRDDPPGAQHRHGEARRVARAHAHARPGAGRARPSTATRRGAACFLGGGVGAPGAAPNSIAPMSGRPTVRAKPKKSVAGRERGIRAVEQQGARGRRRAGRVEVRVADHVGRPCTPARSRTRCARCGCGRTCRRGARPCC